MCTRGSTRRRAREVRATFLSRFASPAKVEKRRFTNLLKPSRWLLAAALAFLSLQPAAGSLRPPRNLTFEERVKAQEAIERVYYSHQEGATLPFEQAVPRETLEKKVVTYLKESIALERFWNSPVTAEALGAEMQRIADRTRFPERLLEIYAALGNDSFLVQECFARPALVDRLARGFWRDDPRYKQDMEAGTAPETEAGSAPFGWDEWWRGAQSDLAERDVAERANPDFSLPRPNSTRHFNEKQIPTAQVATSSCLPEDTWDNGILDDFPLPAVGMSAVWTGNLMIVWGGSYQPTGGNVTDRGGRYNPLIDSWTPTSVVGAPEARRGHTAVWTGNRMIVWGGTSGTTLLGTGSSYDPSSNTWTTLSNSGAPTPRQDHTAVWTGTRMIIWGGTDAVNPLGNGGQYDPDTNQWAAVSLTAAPSARSLHTAVWTGTYMIIWGGRDASNDLNTGARYVPSPGPGSWSPVSLANAPVGRKQHTAVWTGSRMVIWGGANGSSALFSGGLYDPGSDTWSATATNFVPSARFLHTALWTGSRMLVWGGRPADTVGTTGGSFDPASNTWTRLSQIAAPDPRAEHVAVWTGTLMIVWGGSDGSSSLASGGRYNPASDSWTPTATVRRPAQGPAVWTGNEMVVWSGQEADPSLTPPISLDPGARYDPLIDNWTDMGTAGAPSRRFGHSLIWTGSRVIVWGGRRNAYTGFFGSDGLSTGGRYDPINDAWTTMSPGLQGRGHHSAVWTGNKMLVWGGGYTQWSIGTSQFFVVGTGGSYDPAGDSWVNMTTAGAPSARNLHSAVWTGSRMVIWGGNDALFTNFNTGGLYDPASDTWSATTLTNAPSARTLHTAIWSGSRMVIWGGIGATDLDTGARYDPTADSWTPTSTTSVPDPRHSAAAVWTGREMLVWGGSKNNPGFTELLGTGGRYDPVTDSWLPINPLGAPKPSTPSAIWTGGFLIVYGGTSSGGGRYAVDQGVDNDGDGFSDCAGDCNDANPAVHPGATEVCNGRDDDCDGIVDEGFPDADGDGYAACGGDCDDTNPAIHPGAAEECNHIDDDCDSFVDDGYPDNDHDGFAACAGDCNDSNANVHPGATEICNSLDDDCNPATNENIDADGDGFTICTGDCNDSAPAIHPGTPETCNGIDDDCNGSVDDLPDADGDGYNQCTGDCNDSAGSIHPGAVELCNAVDDNCNGVVDDRDADGDGYFGCGGPDCNDSNAAIHPGAQEVCNGVDDNCNLVVDDVDMDGDGFSGCGVDCNDADPSAWDVPLEVTGFHPSSLSSWVWDSQATSIGPGVAYDVASGPIAPNGAQLSAGTCLATVGTPQYTDAQPNPALGWGTWFLVLAKNSCLVGSYGTDYLGSDRPVPPCP